MSSLSRLKLNALDDSTTEYTVCCYYRVFHYSYPVHFCLGHNRSLVCLHAVATQKWFLRYYFGILLGRKILFTFQRMVFLFR